MLETVEQSAAAFMAERHRLMAFVAGLVRDPHVAEDVFQEVWIKLTSELSRGTVIRDLGKWSRQTAKHIILRYWRDRASSKVVVSSELLDFMENLELACAEQTPGDDWIARQQALIDCVRTLPAFSRKLLRLRYEEGVPIKEAATRHALSFDAVTKALYRLRRGLAACVERRLRTGEATT